MATRFVIELSNGEDVANVSSITSDEQSAISNAESQYPGWTIDLVKEIPLDV
jgi:hypothetical protein